MLADITNWLSQRIVLVIHTVESSKYFMNIIDNQFVLIFYFLFRNRSILTRFDISYKLKDVRGENIINIKQDMRIPETDKKIIKINLSRF